MCNFYTFYVAAHETFLVCLLLLFINRKRHLVSGVCCRCCCCCCFGACAFCISIKPQTPVNVWQFVNFPIKTPAPEKSIMPLSLALCMQAMWHWFMRFASRLLGPWLLYLLYLMLCYVALHYVSAQNQSDTVGQQKLVKFKRTPTEWEWNAKVWSCFFFFAPRTVLLHCHVNNLIYIRLSISAKLSSRLRERQPHNYHKTSSLSHTHRSPRRRWN